MKKLHINIIIQARLGSTRLPGKILRPILGRPMLSYLIERVRRIQHSHTLIVATTQLPRDDEIVSYCENENVLYYRGSEEDVLDRYYQTCCHFPTDLIVRITSDCPLIDPAIIDQAISLLIKNSSQLDYVSNTLLRTFPRGMDVEVFTFQALKIAAQEASRPFDREHVTPYIYKHPDLFNIANLVYMADEAKYRLTVDTIEDFNLVNKIFENLYPTNKNFTLTDILDILKVHPEWKKINAHIKQKET